MDAKVFSNPSVDQSLSHKQWRNHKKDSRPSKFPDGAVHAPLLSLSFPYPPTSFSLNPPPQRNPPLLPLPFFQFPINDMPRNRGLPCPPINRKTSERKKNSKLQSKEKTPTLKRDLGVNTVKFLGPDPIHPLPVDVSRVSSPPPSSLPLPTFSLRPKVSCNAEADGIDAGATDDIRRLLRLR